MKSVEQLITDIEYYVLSNNEYHDRTIESELRRNTLDTVEKIVEECSCIKAYKKRLSKDYTTQPENIKCHIDAVTALCCDFDMHLPENRKCMNYLDENGYTRWENNPSIRLEDILKCCKELSDILLSKGNVGIQQLHQKYANKWLYIEGYEAGSTLIYITDITLVNDDILWTGAQIDLDTINCSGGHGVKINAVEDGTFDNLPYFENAYDWAKTTKHDKIEYLNRWLSYGRYGSNTTGHENSREVTSEQVYDIIIRHLSWGIEELSDFGVEVENIFE